MTIQKSMAGYIIDNKYEVFETHGGEWLIWDIYKKQFVNYGGTKLVCNNKDAAIKYLGEINK